MIVPPNDTRLLGVAFYSITAAAAFAPFFVLLRVGRAPRVANGT